VNRPVPSTLILLALAACLVGCGQTAAMPNMQRPPAPVSVVEAVAKDVPVYLDEIGRCEASEEINVVPQVSGRILEIQFKDGAELAKGAPLFTIDKRPYEARLAEAKARHSAAKAGVEQARAAHATAEARVGTAKSKLAQALATATAARAGAEEAKSSRSGAESDNARAAADLERFEGVSKTGGVSAQELDRVRSEAKSAASKLAAAKQREAATAAEALEAEAAGTTAEKGIAESESLLAEAASKIVSSEADVLQAAAAVQTAELDVEYCTLTSPIAGRAGRRLIDLGNVVFANTSPLLTIRKIDPAYVEFTVTENDLTSVQRNMARAPLSVEVRLPDEPATPGVGALTFLDSAVVGATGTVKLRATLPNPDGRFWPGRFVKVRLVLDTIPGAVLVPAGAPMTSAEGSIVFVVKPDDTAEMRPVVLGQRHGELMTISKGVAAGERVIVVGQIGVTPGGKVAVVKPPPAPEAPGAPAAGAGK